MNFFKSERITEPHEFLSAIVSNALFGIISLDSDFKLLLLNKLAKQCLKLSNNLPLIVDKPIYEAIELSELDLLKKKLIRCHKKGRKPFVLTATEIQGKYYTIRGSLLLDGMLITIQNITPIIEAQKTTLNSMIKGQEEERKRLAIEIHDGIGPLVSTTKMNFEAIESDMEDNYEHLKRRFEQGYAMLDELAEEARNLSHALMPRVLNDFGLITAIGSLVDKINYANKIEVNFYHSDLDDRLPKEMDLAFYRVIQEIVNNALKYAKATKLDIQLIKRTDSIMIQIEDNGIGFDLEEVIEKGKGLGLMNIETRIIFFGGTVHIDTQKERGTLFTIEIPLKQI